MNRPIPTTRRTAPAKNSSNVSRGTGDTVMASSKMIKLTGSTLERASWVFSFSALLMMTIPPSSFWIFDMYEVYKIYYITGPQGFL